MGYPHSVRGIKRNIVKNELKGSNRRRHYGRELSIEDRERIREKNKDVKLGKRQSVFGAIFKQENTRRTQAR